MLSMSISLGLWFLVAEVRGRSRAALELPVFIFNFPNEEIPPRISNRRSVSLAIASHISFNISASF